MNEALRIGASVATPLGLCGLALVVAFGLYLQHLRARQKRIDSLTPDQRLPVIEEGLRRYGLSAANLTRDAKERLLRDEMNKRFWITVIGMVLGTLVLAGSIVSYVYVQVLQKPIAEIDHPPSPAAPTDGAAIVGLSVNLAWNDPDAPKPCDYIVEVNPAGPAGSEKIPVRSPEKTTRYPSKIEKLAAPGSYKWRVSRAREGNGGVLEPTNQWSQQSHFALYETALGRIKATGELRLGVVYHHHSLFMREGESGPTGFDWDLVKELANQLARRLTLRNPLKIVTLPYPNMDTGLNEGVRDNQIDLFASSV